MHHQSAIYSCSLQNTHAPHTQHTHAHPTHPRTPNTPPTHPPTYTHTHTHTPHTPHTPTYFASVERYSAAQRHTQMKWWSPSVLPECIPRHRVSGRGCYSNSFYNTLHLEMGEGANRILSLLWVLIRPPPKGTNSSSASIVYTNRLLCSKNCWSYYFKWYSEP